MLCLFRPLSYAQRTAAFDVLVINGGTGGVAAGIQAARSGAHTLIVEPTPWLGGMLTAAGVSATDGNHNMPAGLWGEFREQLRTHYGGKAALETGWVSNTHFEPHVGARIFDELAQRESRLKVWFQSTVHTIQKQGSGWLVRIRQGDKTIQVRAKILVDATDLGDIAAQVGVPFDLGMDAASETGEPFAPATANDIIQDLTLVAILKDYGTGQDKTIPKPHGYTPDEFRCACKEVCPDSTGVPCAQMLTYAKLPGGKYMLNWPNAGNDLYVNIVGKKPKQVSAALESAKQQTLRYIYFIQHELGYKHLGLAEDEFPTSDKLALYPYHREGRRIKGLVRVTATHLATPYAQTLYRTGGIVGDYPIDHHHKKNPTAPKIDFPAVPSFNIPLGALIPKYTNNLLIADKAISVSNIVNGSSRLQPVVLQIGQAAGVMAALAVREGCTPAALPVRTIQQALLDAGGWLLPFFDVPAQDPHFKAIQRIGACGILQGRGEPYKWANRTWFDPDSLLSVQALQTGLTGLPVAITSNNASDVVTILDAIQVAASILQVQPEMLETRVSQAWSSWNLSPYQPTRPITRREFAVLLDTLVNPFTRWPVDWEGRY